MKKNHVLCIAFALSLFPLTLTAEKKESSSKLDETDKLAFQTYNNTMQSIYEIVKDPDNKQNVFANIGAILSGILHFVGKVLSQKKEKKAMHSNEDMKEIVEALNRALQKMYVQVK